MSQKNNISEIGRYLSYQLIFLEIRLKALSAGSQVRSKAGHLHLEIQTPGLQLARYHRGEAARAEVQGQDCLLQGRVHTRC